MFASDKLSDLLIRYDQSHILEHLKTLPEDDRKNLTSDLLSVDFDLMKHLFLTAKEYNLSKKKITSPIVVTRENLNKDSKLREDAINLGMEIIRSGEVCALLVAGGQASRLGYEYPKGMFPISPIKNKSLFQLFSERLLSCSKKYNVSIPFLIMTSKVNHLDTINFFEENNYFGLNKDDVIFFSQNMIPSVDLDGKLILNDKTSLFRNPDGHGGSLQALLRNGILDVLEGRGIRYLSYFQVDNPLINFLDPLFIGLHVLNQSEISSKTIEKNSVHEKMGTFVLFEDGKTGVVEYSDLSDELIKKTASDGEFSLKWGNVGFHFMNLSFVNSVLSAGEAALPYHIALKGIPSFLSGNEIVKGYKFEKFIFDCLVYAKKTLIVQTLRNEEFAPLKNLTGADSIESCRKMMSDLYASWLRNSGYFVAENVLVEISPNFALSQDEIPLDIKLPKGNIYLN